MKVLITGGSGRIGKYLIKYLSESKKFELWFLKRNSLQEKFTQTIQLDLTKNFERIPKEASIKFDLVIHMAGITHVKDTKELGKKNNKLNENFLKFLLIANKSTPLIFFSSVDVYGIKNQKFPINVQSECWPSSFYGKSKLYSEELFRKNLNKIYVLRIAPMIEYEGEKDYLKRIYLPGTRIKFKSPYPRENNFSSIGSIYRSLEMCINGNAESVINVTNERIYSDKDFLHNSKFSLKIPKIILDIVFLLLRTANTPFCYSLEHKFHKLFKTNTYV
jgi:nucleoside-diphosphate-sugar epimerase